MPLELDPWTCRERVPIGCKILLDFVLWNQGLWRRLIWWISLLGYVWTWHGSTSRRLQLLIVIPHQLWDHATTGGHICHSPMRTSTSSLIKQRIKPHLQFLSILLDYIMDRVCDPMTIMMTKTSMVLIATVRWKEIWLSSILSCVMSSSFVWSMKIPILSLHRLTSCLLMLCINLINNRNKCSHTAWLLSTNHNIIRTMLYSRTRLGLCSSTG